MAVLDIRQLIIRMFDKSRGGEICLFGAPRRECKPPKKDVILNVKVTGPILPEKDLNPIQGYFIGLLEVYLFGSLILDRHCKTKCI